MTDLPPADSPPDSAPAGRATDPAAVAAALRGGEEATFLALVAEHHPVLMRLARLRTDDADDAQNAVCDTWAVFLDQLGEPGDRPIRLTLMRLLLEGLACSSAAAPPLVDRPGTRMRGLTAAEAEMILLCDGFGLARAEVRTVLGLEDTAQRTLLNHARRHLSRGGPDGPVRVDGPPLRR